MTKMSPGCSCIFTVAVISLLLSGTGCLSFDGLAPSKKERINALEEKVDSLSENMEYLNVKNSELDEKFNELALEREQLNEEYSHLASKQAAIESLQESEKIELPRPLFQTRFYLLHPWSRVPPPRDEGKGTKPDTTVERIYALLFRHQYSEYW